jgi:hypothetical protein
MEKNINKRGDMLVGNKEDRNIWNQGEKGKINGRVD